MKKRNKRVYQMQANIQRINEQVNASKGLFKDIKMRGPKNMCKNLMIIRFISHHRSKTLNE